MRTKILFILCFTVAIISVFSFKPFALEGLTLITMSQDPSSTMAKYKDYWEDSTITVQPSQKKDFTLGSQVATLTIPSLSYYEQPIYYGSDAISTNWQFSSPGYADGWGMFGDEKCTVVGAHNYQLFSKLPTLPVGEKFIIETEDDIYTYEISSSSIYDHTKNNWNDMTIDAVEPYSLILMTCYPLDAINTKDMYLAYCNLLRGTVFE